MNILITGANRGIGLALTREFLNRGERVIAGTRQPDNSPELNKLREEPDGRLEILGIDVTRHLDLVTLAYLEEETIGKIDVLINNAAVLLEPGFVTKFESLTPDDFAKTFEVNVTGVVAVTRAFLPLLRKSSHPRIVNISSGAGSISDKRDHGYYCYGASKAALNHLTVGLAHEFRSENIIVTAISPGWVRTDMGGPGAEISAEESAEALAETITHLSMKDSGKFLGRSGTSEGYVW
jgi:NAD(P)-dependent dehydrogenase (short-subunit alcohol dehydrogenase family)